jgi:hypothetical protein
MIQKINLNKIFHLYFCSKDSKHFEIPTLTFKQLSFRNTRDSFFLHFHTLVGMRLSLVTFFQPISFFCGPNFHHEPKVKSYDIFTKYTYKYLFQTTWQKKNQMV